MNQTVKPQTRPKTGGRKPGAVNKASATVKENILAVFNRLNGTAGMADWANANRTEFYKIYARLLPTEIEATLNGSINVILRDPTSRPAGYERKGKASV